MPAVYLSTRLGTIQWCNSVSTWWLIIINNVTPTSNLWCVFLDGIFSAFHLRCPKQWDMLVELPRGFIKIPLFSVGCMHDDDTLFFLLSNLKGTVHPYYKMTYWFSYCVSSLWTRYDSNPCFWLASLAQFPNAFVAQIPFTSWDRYEHFPCLMFTSSISDFVELHNQFEILSGDLGMMCKNC